VQPFQHVVGYSRHHLLRRDTTMARSGVGSTGTRGGRRGYDGMIKVGEGIVDTVDKDLENCLNRLRIKVFALASHASRPS
jgi:hypothetical protein